MKKSLVIGWLYPELMNVYGDIGNITCLKQRCLWRGIKVEVKALNPGFSKEELKSCDLLVMGGAQDREQAIVNKDLSRIKKALSDKIESGTPGLYVCGGFQFLGKYYKEANGNTINGLGIFDLYTKNPGDKEQRLIGNIAVETMLDSKKEVIVGFENHGGRTYLGENVKPFGKVLKGFGNSNDGYEGAVYKNSYGTYLHGPILPKNPLFADHLIRLATKTNQLKDLDDSLENQARKTILDRLGIN